MSKTMNRPFVAALALGIGLVAQAARADDVVTLGMSLPLSGVGANWGKGNEWVCRKAAQEIKEGGGIKVAGKTFNVDCLAYDNKYTSSEGAKVAQTLINRDGVKYLYVFGTPPLLAAQALTERQGVLLFNATWASNSKGPSFPLTFSVENSPFEMVPAMISYVTKTHPQAKVVAALNVNDPAGRDTEKVLRTSLEKAGLTLKVSDFFERGATEFQSIAARLFAQNPDMIVLGSVPPASAGQVWKELSILGFKGVRVLSNGDVVEGLIATAGPAAEGVYMGGAVPFDGPSATEEQRKTNEQARAVLGESLGFSNIGGYDAVYMLKAAMEKSQSLDPAKLAQVMPTVRFHTFYGGETGFGGKASYGSVQQPMLPVFITQIVDGKLVERARVAPAE